ncbi:hypothetical protein BJQ94_19075 [Cryobacterium sp. SO2]|uniref:hypothetical protein n=1 Tax=Cryobacterium sp. SO2 TaxID=1897060 RepID=UPI00223DA393|nr:hypothetical protein [Cryobacterium sp. SO2]WEO77425.1 hypothetical protein BJQ94_19075 [Cryobacterium sp. SO2]
MTAAPVDAVPPATQRGLTHISSRAMTRVVSAVAADALGIAPSQVSVDLADAAGRLDVTVRAPIRVLPLDRADSAPDAQGEDSILARAEQSQHHIRGAVGELTGADIAGVTVRLTSARIRLPRRVR